ncbi:MAG: response regulator transcription factor [Chitinophagales bacterium]|nr:response regulator transcription factor [Chitinophagales bacterium]
MTKEKIRIIITDDHKLFRTGVRNCLEKRSDIEFIGEAENGLQLLKLLEFVKPDIIILNINMPVMNGADTMPIIREKYPDLKVIILSMHNDWAVIRKMIELGANAYLTKDVGSDEIYEAILTLSKQWFFINETVRKAMEARECSPKNGFSAREVEILKKVPYAISIKEIAEQVALSPRTVEAILKKLKMKADVENYTALIEFAKKILNR